MHGTAWEAWSELTPEQRSELLRAIAIRAKALPDAERKTFWENMDRQTELNMKGFYRKAGEEATSTGLQQPTDPVVGIADLFHGTDRWQEEEKTRKAAQQDYQERRLFARKISEIARDDYEPLRSAFGDGGKPGFWEENAYQLPSTISSSFHFMIPGVGPALTGLSMQGDAYESTLDTLMANGMDFQTADRYARALAPAIMLPQMALETVGFGAWTRKLPGFSEALDAVGDRITNAAVRGTMKTLVIGGVETATELGQEATRLAVMDLAQVLDERVPDVRWSGTGGALDGLWSQAPGTLVQIFPLALFGAAGGLNAEARQAAFRSSSTLDKQALGLTPEGIAAIEAAAGPSSLNTAIDAAWETRDPNSEMAQAAVSQLEIRAASLSDAGKRLAALGYPLPQVTAHTDGTFTVTDSSGNELGKATDLSGAHRIAGTHISSIEMQRADRIAEMATMLRGAEILATEHGVEQQLKLGEDLTAEEAAATSPEAAERIAEERALLEEANGGSRDMTLVVLGHHTREIRGNLHQDVSTLYHGAHLGTMLEELSHAKWRAARAAGLTTREEDISLLRAFDTVLAKATRGKSLRFIPEGMMDADVTEARIEEAIGQIAQMEIFRTPKDGKNAFGLPRDLVSAHIGAVAKITGQGTAWKFRSFIEALRTRMGLTMERTFVMKKAEKSGEFDRTTVDAYLAKLVGIESSQAMETTEGASAQDLQAMGSSSGGNTATQQDASGSTDAATAPASGESSPESTFVAKAWKALAAHQELFQFKKGDSPEAEKIAKAISTPTKPIAADVVKSKEDPNHFIVRFYSSSGYLEVIDAHTDEPHISSMYAGSQGKEGGGGSQLYMAALDWIHNNGKTIVDDPGGLSPINEIRRTSNFLASALRCRTTEHLSPHKKQEVGKWSKDDDVNLQNLAIKEMENVFKAIPESQNWRFDFDKGEFRDAKDTLLTKDYFSQMVKSSDPGSSGIGVTTLQRAVITNTALKESQGAKKSRFEEYEKGSLPQALRRISYSLRQSTSKN